MMMKLLRTMLLLAALAGATPAGAAEGFATGPLGPYLLTGSDGTWSGALVGDAYRLANGSDANAATTLFVDPRGGATAYWDVSVEVQVGEEPGGMAGLLYGRQPEEPPFYLALVIDTKGAASILQRNPGGLERLAAFDKAQLIAGGFNTLRIVESPGQFEVFVNGTRVGTARTDVAGTGTVGIIAAGKGSFTFRNFALAPAPGQVPVATATAPSAAAEPALEPGAVAPAEAPPETAGSADATAAPQPSTGGSTDLDVIGYATDTTLPTEPAPIEMPLSAPLVELPLVVLPLPPERPAEFE